MGLGWDTDHTDVDLHVKEPTGEEGTYKVETNYYASHQASASTGATSASSGRCSTWAALSRRRCSSAPCASPRTSSASRSSSWWLSEIRAGGTTGWDWGARWCQHEEGACRGRV